MAPGHAACCAPAPAAVSVPLSFYGLLHHESHFAMQPAVRLLLLLARLRDRAAAWQDLHVNTNTHGDGAAAQQDSIRTCAQLSTTQHDAHNGGFGAEDLSTTVAVVDASLAVLTLSPPGGWV
eukprot:1161664-Pelagomonas_calceolata.AAC.20